MWACARLPRYLKEGVAGTAEAWARDDGTYSHGKLTLKRLVDHRYYNGKRLDERSIRYQLRACEAAGLLVVVAEAAGPGRPREYRLNLAALATLDPNLPELRPPHRRRNGGNSGSGNGGNRPPEMGVTDGGNNGGNRPPEMGATMGATKGGYVLSNKEPGRTTKQDPTFWSDPGADLNEESLRGEVAAPPPPISTNEDVVSARAADAAGGGDHARAADDRNNEEGSEGAEASAAPPGRHQQPLPLPLTEVARQSTPQPPLPALSAAAEIERRAHWWAETHYGELFEQHLRPARYRPSLTPARDLAAARDLCRTWSDERLEQIAVVVLTTNDDSLIIDSDRRFQIFNQKAQWADLRAPRYAPAAENDASAEEDEPLPLDETNDIGSDDEWGRIAAGQNWWDVTRARLAEFAATEGCEEAAALSRWMTAGGSDDGDSDHEPPPPSAVITAAPVQTPPAPPRGHQPVQSIPPPPDPVRVKAKLATQAMRSQQIEHRQADAERALAALAPDVRAALEDRARDYLQPYREVMAPEKFAAAVERQMVKFVEEGRT